MLKYTLLLCLLVLTHCFLSAQEPIKTFVQRSSVPIAAVEPDSVDFSDLEPIGNAIKDARIVMLGEQDHGDAPTFLAKTRLIKYLHEKKGFNVLAFEGDFFGLNDGWDHLDKSQPAVDSFLLKNIYSIWTTCNTAKRLFYQYLPATLFSNQPMIITGFDNQLMTDRSHTHLISALDSVSQLLGLPIIKQTDYISHILPTLDSLGRFYQKPKTMGYFERCGNYLITIKQQLQDKGMTPDNFWMMVIDNLIAEKEELRLAKPDSRPSQTARDQQMAKNLQWLCNNKYRNQKIIVWAANAHIAKFPQYTDGDSAAFTRMGRFLEGDTSLALKIYTLGFTSFDGEAGRLGWPIYQIKKPVSNSFESWIDPSWKYAFTDFKKLADRSQRFYLKGLAHNSRFKYEWANVFDGVFYIRTMYPCKLSASLFAIDQD